MRKFKWVVFIAVLFMACGTLNIGNVPWHLDIQNWSVHQRANFFMATWLAEKHSFDTLNAMENKPENLIKVLKVKREILEQSRVPIRMYVQIVNSGNIPGTESEQEIINWLRQLQQQIIYGG